MCEDSWCVNTVVFVILAEHDWISFQWPRTLDHSGDDVVGFCLSAFSLQNTVEVF